MLRKRNVLFNITLQIYLLLINQQMHQGLIKLESYFRDCCKGIQEVKYWGYVGHITFKPRHETLRL